VQTGIVASDGTFTFINVSPFTNYLVVLSTISYNEGDSNPLPLLPIGWNHTGQIVEPDPGGCNGNGNDGINDGKVIVPVITYDVIRVNFGIRKGGGDVVIG
jgi:hypothetical protein